MTNWFTKTKDSWFVHVLDPGGIFREDGFLGWDLLDLDQTSENEEEAIKEAAQAAAKYAKIQQDESLQRLSDNLTKVLVFMAIILVTYWAIKHNKIKV
jgi:hypothetical protein